MSPKLIETERLSTTECNFPECNCVVPDYAFSRHNRKEFCKIVQKGLDPIQDRCKYGWVLPDRCRYNPTLGCDCGAYPPLKWDGQKYIEGV